ncbi:MAG: ABC transporter ATP-binding protein [Clostridia bacterium]|nr:ABC transporter ATP-binding protein [Clostridia bacterium]
MGEIIKVDHVSMNFRMNMNRTTSMKEWVITKLKRKLQYQDFFALNDVSFAVQRGEIVGIIGTNGSGKSTLLKVISGIYKPSKGTAVTAGRVAPMLELGSGFDYELSGRENIFLNGAIMGYSEEFLHSKYDEIVAFSELGEFIEQPLKTYSSGMMMRLAFSVATLVDPEILIVDEILAVGDERFQKKSSERMMNLMGGGTTVLMVSHDISQIREMCSRAIWLQQGKIRMDGEVQQVCDAYQQFMQTA